MKAYADFETRSRYDLKRGLIGYATDPSTEVCCFSWAIGDGPVQTTRWGETPYALFEHLAAGGEFSAWNVMFEYHIWNHVCVPRYGWPPLSLEQCHDTMALAATQNLPQNLGDCGPALGLDEAQCKSKRGAYLIQRLSKPKRDGSWNEDETLHLEFIDYNRQDVEVERAIAAKLRPMSERERKVWLLTQRMNLRGIPVDLTEVQSIQAIVAAEKARLNHRLGELTGGMVPQATKRNEMVRWLAYRGLAMPSLTGETIAAKLKEKIPADVREALEIRTRVCSTSTAKYDKIRDIAADDGTIKNLFVYHGAGTGRFASRGGLNVQNLPRPPLKLGTLCNDILGHGDHAWARTLLGDDLMDGAVSAIRGVLRAPAGHEFLDADFSSIENRVAVWIAGQDDKVQLFRDGLDEYKTFASNALYHVPYDEVTGDQRQVSKAAILGATFGQGALGLVKYVEGYGIKLELDRAKEIVAGYRSEYCQVANLWYRCGDAILEAIRAPGTTRRAGKHLRFRVQDDWLRMYLPSGRFLYWYKPEEELLDTPWGEVRPGVTVLGVDTETRRWMRTKLIGSSVFQSAVQGLARDLLCHAMTNLDAAGFNLVGCFHDEVLCLERRGSRSLDELEQIMRTPPDWAPDIPLMTEGWVGERFRK